MSLRRFSTHAPGTWYGDRGSVARRGLSDDAMFRGSGIYDSATTTLSWRRWGAMRVATRTARIVWGPHRVFCAVSGDPGEDVCSCGAEYLGEGWWWIPEGGSGWRGGGRSTVVVQRIGAMATVAGSGECSGGADRGPRDA